MVDIHSHILWGLDDGPETLDESLAMLRMAADSGTTIPELRVDGGMVVNELLMQFQSDILDVPVVRPKITETTALGAAYAAGLAVGYWKNRDDLVSNWEIDKRWKPQMSKEKRAALFASWERAVGRSLDWIE